MPRFLRSRPARIGLAVALGLLAAAGFLPLFGGPGYESALAAGLVLPSAIAIATALEVALGGEAPPVESLYRGLANGAVFALGGYALTLLHGLRTGFCDVAGGSAHYALGPGAGALVAGAWGALAGEIARGGRTPRRKKARAVALALLGPLGSIVFSVGRFFASPMVFAYDPFVGFFSGSMYDTIVDYTGLFSYRAGTAATLVAALALALHVHRRAQGGLALRDLGRPGLAATGAAALVLSAAVTAEGDRLDHWETPASIARQLGGELHGDRCDVVYPRSIQRKDVERLARDCAAHVAAGERYFQIAGPPRIKVYLFADAAQKAALMGAADTYIAKPWRREIYIQQNGYPHPVMGHELMHVLAGSFGHGPFRVAGRLGGLLPDPGLIEGTAVAAAPPEGDLTPRQWAKAMKDLGLLPKLDRLFALGFFGENSSTAYTVSGAFVGFIHDRFGAAVLRDWYGGRELPELVGKSWAELESDWHTELDTIALPEAARAQARARFDRPAIFGRRCPHVVDACKQGAERLRSSGDEQGSVEKLEEVLRLDPHDTSSRIAIARSLVRQGHAEEGEQALEAIAADASLPRHARDRALEELGDLALGSGRGEPAVARYAEVASRTVDEDQLRTLDVKIAAARSERARPAVVALLLGVHGRSPDKVLAAELLASWSAAEPADGLPLYLLGRHHVSAGQYDEAAERLDRALAGRIALPRVEAEAERLRMVVACAQGDAGAAQQHYQRYAAHPGVGDARREAARALVGRCTGNLPPAVTASALPEIMSPDPEDARRDAN